jgi:hypothetical protein
MIASTKLRTDLSTIQRWLGPAQYCAWLGVASSIRMERRLSDRAADERIQQLVGEGYLERIDIPKPNGTHLGMTKPSGTYLGLTTQALDLLT